MHDGVGPAQRPPGEDRRCHKREAAVLHEHRQGADSAPMDDRESRHVDVVDRLAIELARPPARDHVDGEARLRGRGDRAHDPRRLADRIRPVHEHADPRKVHPAAISA